MNYNNHILDLNMEGCDIRSSKKNINKDFLQ